MEDRLVIGYDKAEGKDRQALTVVRINNRGTWIVNQFYDKIQFNLMDRNITLKIYNRRYK